MVNKKNPRKVVKIALENIKKPLKTIEENFKGKNIKTINIKTKKVSKNEDLEKLVKKSKLPGYEVVNPKDKEEFLRSIKDKTKKDNLDPKINIKNLKKLVKKSGIKKPKKIK